MLLTRRGLVVGSASILACARPAFAYQWEYDEIKGEAPAFAGTPDGDAPGDMGYKHDEYHFWYQLVFNGHCSCGVGECRVTDWRETKLDSPVGYDVIAYRDWRPLQKTVYIPKGSDVPKALRYERAHICSYELYGVIIPCAIINTTEI